ncbi:MAG: MOSC domain-containing protein [Gammaproteobacteria bacterium]|nr:MOSC domain-containing protein [Gammaproteobacteria bacterium]
MGRLVGIARRDKKRGEMRTLQEAEITDETGVALDYRGKPGKRQVTVISADVWRQVCKELGKTVPWTVRRANLLVEGVELPKEIGGELSIGEVRLQVTGETDPCFRMDEQCAGLTTALKPDWRGGVCCRVLRGGPVSVGDTVLYTGNR